MLCSSSVDGLIAKQAPAFPLLPRDFTRGISPKSSNLVWGRKAKLKGKEGNVKGNLDLQVCHGFRGTRVLDEVSGVFDRDFFLGWPNLAC